jgi:hypothetical protein
MTGQGVPFCAALLAHLNLIQNISLDRGRTVIVLLIDPDQHLFMINRRKEILHGMHTHMSCIYTYIHTYIHKYIYILLGYGRLIFSVHTVDALESSSAMEDGSEQISSTLPGRRW